MRKTAISFITLAVLLAGSTMAFGQVKKLADTRWKLIEAEGIAVTRSLASIEFNATATGFNGNTGCNAMSGEMAVRGSRIDLRRIITTKRMCKLMEGNVGEGTYTDALRKASSFTRTGNLLRLYDRRGRKTLEFTRILGDNHGERIGLDDRKWVLEQIKGRQTFVALPYAFLNFDERKGSAGGNTSCNAFGGSYRVTGNNISFKNIIHTMMACEKDNRMSVEQEFLQGLERADRYEIRGERLLLYRGDKILLTFRGEDK